MIPGVSSTVYESLSQNKLEPTNGPGMVADIYNVSTQETEVGGLCVGSQPRLFNGFKASMTLNSLTIVVIYLLLLTVLSRG